MSDPTFTRSFRDAMGAFPTGVAIVTALRPDGTPCGLTVNSLTSVSLDPVLLLVCLGRASESHDVVVTTGAFAVNVLPDEGEPLSELFAGIEREERFENVPWRGEVTGSPVLEQAVSWLDCRVERLHEAGDHTIVLGRVVALGTTDQEPLVFHRGRYRHLEGP